MKGYDGNEVNVGDRVELHPGCDLWMQGARYGEATRVFVLKGRDKVQVVLDKVSGTRTFPANRVRAL